MRCFFLRHCHVNAILNIDTHLNLSDYQSFHSGKYTMDDTECGGRIVCLYRLVLTLKLRKSGNWKAADSPKLDLYNLADSLGYQHVSRQKLEESL